MELHIKPDDPDYELCKKLIGGYKHRFIISSVMRPGLEGFLFGLDEGGFVRVKGLLNHTYTAKSYQVLDDKTIVLYNSHSARTRTKDQ